MSLFTGWLFDLYAADGGAVLWVIEDAPTADPSFPNLWPDPRLGGRRLRLRQPFPVTFFAAGPDERLRALWRWLRAYAAAHSVSIHLARDQRRDLFLSHPLTVLAVQVDDPACQPQVFSRAARAFPELTYYDADLPLPLRHAAIYDTFPLAYIQAEVDVAGHIQALRVCGSPWDLDPDPAPLRVMHLLPSHDPRHAPPLYFDVRLGRREYRFNLDPSRPMLAALAGLLRQADPDLLLSRWGDTWLLPYLLELARRWQIDLPLNRDPAQPVMQREECSYQAYGRVIHRGRQALLAGRWHIDAANAMLFHDYGLEGVLESARVSRLPGQSAARLSPGAGITAMQVVTALRQGVLTPWHKQQVEAPKTVLELIRADQGGLVYQPPPGVYREVAALDFISMYPSIMARFNISPETIRPAAGACLSPELDSSSPETLQPVPGLDLCIDTRLPGLVPQTLQPLLDKRIRLKQRLAGLPAWDPRRKTDQARAAAHKWLLVTCFGYLGYKNARFGRIEAHQAVTAYSRECLLCAKEAAEQAGFEVLHLYVDGLWVYKPERPAPVAEAPAAYPPAVYPPAVYPPADLQLLLDDIAARTGLPVGLEGIYRWVVFSASKIDPRLGVANRYFGVFQDGSLKLRGIEARRTDTPTFIAQTQLGILDRLAGAVPGDPDWPTALQAARAYTRQRLRLLRQPAAVPAADLLVTQRLSRDLDQYCSPSPAARAAAQLLAAGKPIRPGMPIRLLYLRGDAVHAWDCPPSPDPARLDIARYTRLLLRACATLLEPFGVAGHEIYTSAGCKSLLSSPLE